MTRFIKFIKEFIEDFIELLVDIIDFVGEIKDIKEEFYLREAERNVVADVESKEIE